LKRIVFLILVCVLVTILLQPVKADRGLIPVTSSVSIYEPGQKAILAWNGQEEIMILSTDVSSTSETLLLEILPLPSQPVVEAASFHSFEEIQRHIWNEGVNLYYFGDARNAASGSVQLVFHDQIGAHNITVVSALDTSELVNWINGFLIGSGVNKQLSLGEFESTVLGYMQRGFRYYCLDIITVSPTKKSVDPLLYRFNSSFLYYPLLITSPVGGDTDITLFLLTENKVAQGYSPMLKAYYRPSQGSWQHIEFVLSKGELARIDLRVGELFQDQAWLTVLTYSGYVSAFDEDLMLTEASMYPTQSSTGNPQPIINVNVDVPTSLVVVCILLGGVSVLGGVLATALITRSRKKT